MLFIAIIVALFGFVVHRSSSLSVPTALNRRKDPTTSDDVLAVIDATINAMGGLDALKSIKTFTYHANSIYRSHALTQNYNLFSSDQSVAAAGSQNMSFSLEEENLRSRIDRSYIYDDYWIWGFPDLQPFIDFSLVVQDGPQGFACFTKGQNSFFARDPSIASGYTDPFLTDYLIHQAQQFALPGLVQKFRSDASSVEQYDVYDSTVHSSYAALEHMELGLTILINTTTHLPHAIRSFEYHVVYGNSTSDLVLSAWNNVSTGNADVLLPHRFQTVYNSEIVLEDFLADAISINDEFPSDYFNGRRSSDNANGPPLTKNESIPAQSPEYPRSEVHEFFESGLWAGPFGYSFDTSDIVIEHPFPGFENIMTIYVSYADYVQVIVEHENGLLITDAAPHRSKIILDWVEKHMNGKRITHVIPSHHHRDHAGGVDDYVAAGATLVVPEVARDLYNLTGRVQKMTTYTDTEPFVFKDKFVELCSFWRDENPHARDWSFSVATRARSTDDDGFVIFSADVINPGTDATKWDSGVARQFILNMIDVGVPRSSLLIGAHGSSHGGTSTSESLADIAEIVGMTYPPLSAEDWRSRGHQ